MKHKVLQWVKENGLTGVFYLIAFVAVVFFGDVFAPGAELWDLTIFSSMVAVMIIDFLGKFTTRLFIGRNEDFIKLRQSGDELIKLYQNDNLLTFQNQENGVAYQKLKRKYKLKASKTKFPVIQDYQYESGMKLGIEDNNEKKYSLPEQIARQYDDLMKSHDTSTVYNQLNIRVDDWVKGDKTFTLKTSRTTYFDSLVTNRSVDYSWKNKLTTRQLYAYGPFAPRLSESVFSNHLGFNGFVESSDEYIPFVKRSAKVSIAKKTYGASVNASLKTKFALEAKGERVFAVEGLKAAILKEVEDELNIEKTELVDVDLGEVIIAAYRELVEGGKPQLLFYLKCKQDRATIERNFMKKKSMVSKSKWNEMQVLMDGEELVWVHRNQLCSLAIAQNCMVVEEIKKSKVKAKAYKMAPTVSASVVMLIDYLKKKRGATL